MVKMALHYIHRVCSLIIGKREEIRTELTVNKSVYALRKMKTSKSGINSFSVLFLLFSFTNANLTWYYINVSCSLRLHYYLPNNIYRAWHCNACGFKIQIHKMREHTRQLNSKSMDLCVCAKCN